MLTKEDIAVVVVWYNPVQEFVQNILTYSCFFKNIYIVDNSTEDNSELAAQIADCVYIPNYANLGIAAALNTGCRKAMEDGFLWCMTMDQDSQWEREQLERYVSASVDKIKEDIEIKSVAPRYVCSDKNSVYSIIKRKIYRIGLKTEPELVDHVICIGNLIELSTWKNTGCFNEVLFIDEVDHDFCYRLRRQGFKILLLNQFYLNHVLGDEIKRLTLFPKFNHSSFRLFYIFRNRLYIIKEYPEMAKKIKYRNDLLKLVIQTCILNRHAVRNIKVLISAFNDYKNKFCK